MIHFLFRIHPESHFLYFVNSVKRKHRPFKGQSRPKVGMTESEFKKLWKKLIGNYNNFGNKDQK